MMYNEKLAVAIKSAGKVLREFKDRVYVPFGAEYSIFIKNLNSVRASVKVSIDGQPVDDSGQNFVIEANSSLDLERFLRNGNMNEGNRFKFIERTGKVENHRGIQVEDGLIRVEFQYEKRPPKVEVEEVHHYKKHYWHDDWYGRPWWYRDSSGTPYIRQYMSSDNTVRGIVGTSDGSIQGSSTLGDVQASYTTNTASEKMSYVAQDDAGWKHDGVACNAVMDSMLVNEAGITVAGSKSKQQFVIVDNFPVEDTTHVIVLKLLGETTHGKKVKQAVTVKTKQKCPTCGHMNKATTKFCAECGTGLEIV